MKKVLGSLFLVSLLLVFVGCSSEEPTETETTPENDVVEDYDEDSDVDYDNDWFVSDLSAPGTFTHTVSGLEFIANDNWNVEDQGEGSIFIAADDASIVINLLGTFDVNSEWSDPLENMNTIFRTMLQDHFGGEGVEIQQLDAGEIGYAVLKANYTLSFGGQTYPAIGFIVSNGEQFALLSGVLEAENADLEDSYFEFVSSIRFE